jgi:hypothetical protein
VDASTDENILTFQIPVPISNVIHLELLSASDNILDHLIQIDGWGENVTSKGRLYWRYVDSTSNQRFTEWQTTDSLYREPKALRNLTISLWKPNGEPFSQKDDYNNISIELAVYSLRQ